MKKILCIFLLIMMAFSTTLAWASEEPAAEDWRQELSLQYEEMLPDLSIRAEEWEAEMATCTEEEKTIMQYYFICTGMSELCSINFSLLHSYATHAAMLRETMPWTQALDEDTFLCYVAAYQVFREPVVDCRPFFYDQLIGRIEGKSLEEAALRVNQWCGEQATYSESDQREASPLGMVNGGFGRCGEESNFVVNVLRSVGIPARVCNVDWTIVAGGHAFVQVLIDGEWHYMGACEPSPKLDNGWFTGRLGSLLTTQSYSFSDIGVGQPSDTSRGLTIVNDIGNFTDTKEVTVTVLDEQGNPAYDACIDVRLVQQEANLTNVTTLYTDENGQVRFTLGRGSAGIVAYYGDDWRWAWIAAEETETVVSFAEPPVTDTWQAFPVRYSDAEPKQLQAYTQEEEAAFFGEKSFNEIREENHAGDFDAERAAAYPDCEASLRSAGRNFSELIAFLEKDEDPLRSTLVAGISDKYTREVKAEVLEDILQGAKNVRGDLSDEAFINGILYPVTEFSYLSPQRLAVQQMFSEEEMRAFREDPTVLAQWFREHISDEWCIRVRKGGIPELSAALEMGYCTFNHQPTLLMELARAIGIPVCQDPETGAWYTLGADGWIPAAWSDVTGEGGSGAYGQLEYLIEGSEKYMGNFWTIVSNDFHNSYEYVLYWLVEEADEDTVIDFPAGDYAMVFLDMQEEKAGTFYMYRFTVEEGKTTTLSMP